MSLSSSKKYLKYKTKYTNLRNMVGGLSNDTIANIVALGDIITNVHTSFNAVKANLEQEHQASTVMKEKLSECNKQLEAAQTKIAELEAQQAALSASLSRPTASSARQPPSLPPRKGVGSASSGLAIPTPTGWQQPMTNPPAARPLSHLVPQLPSSVPQPPAPVSILQPLRIAAIDAPSSGAIASRSMSSQQPSASALDTSRTVEGSGSGSRSGSGSGSGSGSERTNTLSATLTAVESPSTGKESSPQKQSFGFQSRTGVTVPQIYRTPFDDSGEGAPALRTSQPQTFSTDSSGERSLWGVGDDTMPTAPRASQGGPVSRASQGGPVPQAQQRRHVSQTSQMVTAPRASRTSQPQPQTFSRDSSGEESSWGVGDDTMPTASRASQGGPVSQTSRREPVLQAQQLRLVSQPSHMVTAHRASGSSNLGDVRESSESSDWGKADE